jgi:hypothetical protein
MDRFWAEVSKDLALAGIAVIQGMEAAEGLWGYESLRSKLDKIQAAGFAWVLVLGCALPFFLFWIAVVNLWPRWRERRRGKQ